MADNKTLVVGNLTQTFYVVDEDAFSLTPRQVPNISYVVASSPQALLRVALANKKR
jgi:hypothetical protein